MPHNYDDNVISKYNTNYNTNYNYPVSGGTYGNHSNMCSVIQCQNRTLVGQQVCRGHLSTTYDGCRALTRRGNGDLCHRSALPTQEFCQQHLDLLRAEALEREMMDIDSDTYYAMECVDEVMDERVNKPKCNAICQHGRQCTRDASEGHPRCKQHSRCLAMTKKSGGRLRCKRFGNDETGYCSVHNSEEHRG